jgi:hypothetical protein
MGIVVTSLVILDPSFSNLFPGTGFNLTAGSFSATGSFLSGFFTALRLIWIFEVACFGGSAIVAAADGCEATDAGAVAGFKFFRHGTSVAGGCCGAKLMRYKNVMRIRDNLSKS